MSASMTCLTAKPSAGASHAPVDLAGDTAMAACYGPTSPRRLVTDVVASEAANASLYRYSPALEDWVQVEAVQAVGTAPKGLRWGTDGIEGYYAVVLSAGTGTWQPIPAETGP